MAEFKKVLEEAIRMCKHRTTCEGCVINDGRRGCIVSGLKKNEPEQIEEAILRWSKEHPQKKYPTWKEWGLSIATKKNAAPVLPCNFIECDRCDKCYVICPRLDEEVPEDFAMKARILPINEKG